MSVETELGIVVSARPWAEKLHRFTVDHGGARVRTRVLRPEDAVEQAYDVLLIDDITSFLNRRLVQQVHGAGRRIVGVYDGQDNPEGKRFLAELGVDEVIDAGASPDEFVRVISGLQPVRTVSGDDPRPDEPVAAADGSRDGVMIAVGAASGGVGATEVALGLASTISGGVRRALVIDADDVLPSVAQRLGLALHPNVRTSVDAFLHQPDVLPATIQSLRKRPIDVIGGLSNPKDWIELRPADVVALARDLSVGRPAAIVNVSSRAEDLAFYGGPGRYGLSRALLAAADEVVLVAAPTPIGVARLLDSVADLRADRPHHSVHVLINRAPRSAFKQGELIQEISRTFTPASLVFVPDDPRVAEAAWAGEIVTNGPFAKAMSELAAGLAPLAASRAS
ncbi:MAG: ParA family protein [Acidimicrobiia bacterium]|nr:ParA family protein [Acidimicrobiia bacterium]